MLARYSLRLALALALLGLAGCSPQPAKPPPPQVKSPIARIFAPDMLSAQVPYLEKTFGLVAYHVDGLTRTYKVGSCMVDVTTDKQGNIASLGLETVSRECSFDLAPFVGAQHAMPVDRLAFGQLYGPMADGKFYADCIYLCGNAADPVVTFFYEGPHSLQFLQVAASVTLVDDASINAAGAWQAAMKPEGQDYVVQTRFNCDNKYEAAARTAFSNVRISAISVGYSLSHPTSCSG
jgi:hypothetical protein